MSKQLEFEFKDGGVNFELERHQDVLAASVEVGKLLERWETKYGVPKVEIEALLDSLNILL